MKKTIYDIFPDRVIHKEPNMSFANLDYECWLVQLSIGPERIEALLENGFFCSVNQDGLFHVYRQMNPSPEQLQNNKWFWRRLNDAITNDSNSILK